MDFLAAKADRAFALLSSIPRCGALNPDKLTINDDDQGRQTTCWHRA
jgi:hypothetical protein